MRDRFENLTKFLDGFLDMGVPGYDTAVYQNGECVYRRSNGYANLEQKTPFTGSERYNIYSCSKPITCTAALQLFEKGMYKLEDHLSDYMPEFKNMTVRGEGGPVPAKNAITVKDLFCMTAGFSYNLASPQLVRGIRETGGRAPTREMMKYLAQEPLLFEPGTAWEYSLCHDVLAALVEVISGEKFEEYVRKNVFEPMGMTRSTFMLPDEELSGIAEQYRFNAETGKVENIGPRIPYKLGSEYASGGAGCISMVDDYIRFLEGLRTGKLIRPETLKMMTTHQLSDECDRTYTSNDRYGYGLGVRCPFGRGRTDFGWGGAAGAHLAIEPALGVSVYHAQHILNPQNRLERSYIITHVTEALK